jgi:hypothetical protein
LATALRFILTGLHAAEHILKLAVVILQKVLPK